MTQHPNNNSNSDDVTLVKPKTIKPRKHTQHDSTTNIHSFIPNTNLNPKPIDQLALEQHHDVDTTLLQSVTWSQKNHTNHYTKKAQKENPKKTPEFP